MFRLLLSFPLLGAVALAADYYVSPLGLNTNPGTEAEPWQTIQRAANAGAVAAGDTVFVRSGTYAERVTVNVSGSAGSGFITFRNYPNETPVIDATGLTPPQNTDTALFLLVGRSYVRIEGFELRNYKATTDTNNQNMIPSGVQIRGASHHIEIRGNKIHDIWNHFADGNAFGLAVYGDATTPMSRIVIDGNEVYQCRTGNSETIAINGNVTDWEATNNLVHDNTNIGIDAIGYETTCCGGTSDPALDRARGGVIRGNTVWNCSSAGTTATGVPPNPAYGGQPGAGGIYVDGGTNLIIERNTSYQNDIGIELASEHAGKATDFVTVRDNVVWRNKIGGLFMGGSGSGNGRAENNTATSNTFWQNDTNNDGNGEIQFQFYVFNNMLKNNLVIAGAQNLLFSNPVPALVSGAPANSGNVIDFNAWHSPSGAAGSSWQWKNSNLTGFNGWKTTSAQDAHSQFNDPKLVNPALSGTAPPAAPDLHLRLDSPCIDSGDAGFIPAAGETDFDRGPRVTGGRVDQGADELSPRDAWRVEKFGAAATGTAAAFSADPDADGLGNLLEYALGSEPLAAGTLALPFAGRVAVGGNTFLTLTFTHPLLTTDVTFVVQAGGPLTAWDDGSRYGPPGDVPSNSFTTQVSRTASGTTETIVVRDNVPLLGSPQRFLRLRVTEP